MFVCRFIFSGLFIQRSGEGGRILSIDLLLPTSYLFSADYLSIDQLLIADTHATIARSHVYASVIAKQPLPRDCPAWDCTRVAAGTFDRRGSFDLSVRFILRCLFSCF